MVAQCYVIMYQGQPQHSPQSDILYLLSLGQIHKIYIDIMYLVKFDFLFFLGLYHQDRVYWQKHYNIFQLFVTLVLMGGGH